MLLQAVETSLAVRRAADFTLDAVERSLRSFAPFATAQGDTTWSLTPRWRGPSKAPRNPNAIIV